jgi:hypothetical protein
MGFLSVLTLIFITLKLTEFIDWSWWFILAPTLIHVCVMLSTIIGLIIFTVRKK